ncbi:hypothetical protein WJX74_005050 [Apatococcus lobatus]|uniref:Guanylyl cyclase n=1 Tax=Apatococcus lobatus TaxID=904363 RepID=A0AAW1S6R5_9CHLO
MVALGQQTFAAAATPLNSMVAELAFVEACRLCCSWDAPTWSSHGCDISVPHIHQTFNWDCGLACVKMVLGAFQVDCPELGVLRSLCATQSVWTVDLAHLLRKFCLDVTFTTLTVGANPQYCNESFYMEHLQEDAERVEQLFQGAQEAGIFVECRSVALLELQGLMLTGNHLVIALIDRRALGSNDVWLSESAASHSSAAVMDSGYAGHYVVISGYNAADDLFSVCDPALASGHIKIPSAMLELARTAFGTDEDLLIIPRPQQLKNGHAEDDSTICIQACHQETPVAGSPEASLRPLEGTTGSAALC